jgi:hypothetical protein
LTRWRIFVYNKPCFEKLKTPSTAVSVVSFGVKVMKNPMVPHEKRNSFLEIHFANPLFDLVVYHIADSMLKGYEGGYWDYFEGESGVAFLALSGSSNVTLKNIFSGEEIEVDNRLAGMILTSFALLYQVENDGHNGYICKLKHLNEAIAQLCSKTGRMDVWMTLMD